MCKNGQIRAFIIMIDDIICSFDSKIKCSLFIMVDDFEFLKIVALFVYILPSNRQ